MNNPPSAAAALQFAVGAPAAPTIAAIDGCASPRPVADLVATVVAGYPDSALTTLTGHHYRYLIARTRSGEGIYLVTAADGDVGDFTEEIYEACVREGEREGLHPAYHIHSRYNLFATPGVYWTQLSTAPRGPARSAREDKRAKNRRPTPAANSPRPTTSHPH
ncbi:hypothetical protein [Nocardia sp. NPDC047648]|uniref:hypothetical protein n=1 Tax=Nocardia sp. NPDC047648 TaxID=3155625 RepID=UPI0033F41590